jgi:AcrR family transcriptional regulator
VTVLEPRKRPRQARSKATVAAILEASARLLGELGYARVTTNRIAERAGVGIGTLYEFFPNRESVIVALAQHRFGELARAIEVDLESALRLEGMAATRFLIGRLVDAVSSDRALFRVLLREAPLLRELPEVQQAQAAILAVGWRGAQRASSRIDLPDPEADTWLVSRMVGNAILEMAFAGPDAPAKDRLTAELARLTFRMLRGEPGARPGPRARGRR